MTDTPQVADQTAETSESSSPSTARKVLPFVGLALLLGGAWWGWDYLNHGRYIEETNDAQIAADTLAVAPRISGYVAQVLVVDNQDVKAGTPLLTLDPRDYKAKTAQASAQVAIADALQANAQAAMEEQRAGIEQARAQLVAAQAKAKFDADQVKRFAPLVASGAEQAQQLAQLRAAADQSAAQVRAQSAAIEAQQRRIAAIEAQARQAKAQGMGGKAQLDAASVDLDATTIRATIDGRVGDKNVTPGQFVSAGTRLMTLVPLSKIYVVANFKETQLAHMRPGQAVSIKVDALDGRAVKGRIESMAPGTGASFSLIAPSNATGNFTKIVQRVPVRIAIDADADTRRLLVPGLSVTAMVDTKTAH
ncbi:HlyD family secretion protein [Novosphingobium sp. KACC 22771]|uniref:HlyD family secretion protein n=1 Tax=Novosphingobium sp. KACC 22771 TaxID=3025670 RepID=UPI00236675AF|nr:HlyD family secretion protein [Novosphingobium sp. KACC 22771]WDF72651.1 HlyD family secretion protein [Novosphingobium sp. KACC 22771]